MALSHHHHRNRDHKDGGIDSGGVQQQQQHGGGGGFDDNQFINNPLGGVQSTTGSQQAAKMFVGGLPQSIMSDSLREYFSSFGPVQEAFVLMDESSGRSRGFGFVTFDSAATLIHVLNSRPHILDNKQVDCKHAVMKGQTSRDQQQQQQQQLQPTSSLCSNNNTRPSNNEIDNPYSRNNNNPGVLGIVPSNSNTTAINNNNNWGGITSNIRTNSNGNNGLGLLGANNNIGIKPFGNPSTHQDPFATALNYNNSTSGGGSSSSSSSALGGSGTLDLASLNDTNVDDEQAFFLTGGGKSYLALSGDKWLEDCAEADERKIFVGGLPDVTPAEFAGFFEHCGPVADAMVMFDRKRRRQRGFGFITFATKEGVHNALQYHHHPVKGKLVEVKKAHPLVLQNARAPAKLERDAALKAQAKHVAMENARNVANEQLNQVVPPWNYEGTVLPTESSQIENKQSWLDNGGLRKEFLGVTDAPPQGNGYRGGPSDPFDINIPSKTGPSSNVGHVSSSFPLPKGNCGANRFPEAPWNEDFRTSFIGHQPLIQQLPATRGDPFAVSNGSLMVQTRVRRNKRSRRTGRTPNLYQKEANFISGAVVNTDRSERVTEEMPPQKSSLMAYHRADINGNSSANTAVYHPYQKVPPSPRVSNHPSQMQAGSNASTNAEQTPDVSYHPNAGLLSMFSNQNSNNYSLPHTQQYPYHPQANHNPAAFAVYQTTKHTEG